MASCTNAELRVAIDVANANVEGDATITFTEFDRNTNIGWNVFLKLVGADNPPLDPDDELASPPARRFFVRADGRQTAELEWRPDTIPLTDLDEDTGDLSYELKLVVDLVPFNPVASTTESSVVLLQPVGA